MVTPDETQFQIQAQWVLDNSAVPAAVNQFLLQPAAPLESGAIDGAYLTIGHLNPPMLPGYAGPLNSEILAGQIFPVIPVARVLVSMPRLRDLRDNLDKFIEAMEGHEPS